MRFRLVAVGRPSDPHSLALPQRGPNPLQFFASEEALASVLAIFFDLFCRIQTLWHEALAFGERIKTADYREQPIGLIRSVLQLVMQSPDLRRGDRLDFTVAEAGHGVGVQ